MMGRTHALTGLCAGLAVGPAVGLHTLAEVAPFAVTTAGYALLPDIDHKYSTVTHAFGPVSRGVSVVARKTSAGLYELTKGPRDESGRGEHRHLTHTLLFAAVLGVLVFFGTKHLGPVAVGVVIWIGVLLAQRPLRALKSRDLRKIGNWTLAIAGLMAFGYSATADALDASYGVIGLAVSLGCFVHCLGDALTNSGCPFLFPVPIAGETWFELRPPESLRFPTGGLFETWVAFPGFCVLAALLIPGVWPIVVEVVGRG